jgi:7-carboxy-7-deazaguanine synthase
LKTKKQTVVETDTGLFLPVMESFSTIQGEGFYQGAAATFIRLGGCDVGCVWCDVKESWNVENHPLRTVDALVAEAKKRPAEIVVITGGEPCMHELGPLTEKLREAGKKTNLETSGAYPLSGSWDWICVSPKKFKEALPEVLHQADELKVVIYHPSDLQWAESFVSSLKPTCKLFLQPEWEKRERVLPIILDYIKAHPKWQLSLQIHKYIGVP